MSIATRTLMTLRCDVRGCETEETVTVEHSSEWHAPAGWFTAKSIDESCIMEKYICPKHSQEFFFE